jgi:putative transposase
MTTLEERKTLIGLLSEATLAGARQAPACGILGLSERTVQRWQSGEPDAVDRRSLRLYEPSHKLSADERAELLAVANSAEFGHLPPSQIVPRLADQQRYIASESTFYRVLREEKQLAHRRSERPAGACGKPRAICADAPNQLYSWDTQSKIASERRTDLTRAGIGRAALALTCRSGSGVPRALPGSPSVT